jgi:hypothetical protein
LEDRCKIIHIFVKTKKYKKEPGTGAKYQSQEAFTFTLYQLKLLQLFMFHIFTFSSFYHSNLEPGLFQQKNLEADINCQCDLSINSKFFFNHLASGE